MNIEKLRADTVGCGDKLFFNSAGASLMPKPVIEVMSNYLNEEAQIGGYALANNKQASLSEFYIEAAKLLNCATQNIALLSSATDAYSKALSAIPFSKGDYILTTNDDYTSNQIAFLSLQKRFNLKVVRCKNLPNGDIDFDSFNDLLIKHKPVLVAITHIPTSSGLVQNVEKAGEYVSKTNAWYLVDACQSVGQIEVDVTKIKCDFLSATGRKFLRGPRGTGFLYVSERVLTENVEPLFVDMKGAQWVNGDNYELQKTALRFEQWEFNCSNQIGLAEAIKYANNIGVKNIREYNSLITNYFKKGLNEINKVTVLDKGSVQSSIITFNVVEAKLETLQNILNAGKIYYSVTLKENAYFDFTEKGVDWAIRISPHYFNTKSEVDEALNILELNKKYF